MEISGCSRREISFFLDVFFLSSLDPTLTAIYCAQINERIIKGEKEPDSRLISMVNSNRIYLRISSRISLRKKGFFEGKRIFHSFLTNFPTFQKILEGYISGKRP